MTCVPHTPDPIRTRAVALAILAECERRGCAGCSLGDAAKEALTHV